MSLAAVLAPLLAAAPARGYDFAIDATTTAQGYQLRWFRFTEPDRLLNRRVCLRCHVTTRDIGCESML